MMINLDQKILGIDGVPIQNGPGSILKLIDVVQQVLQSPVRNENEEGKKEKVRRYCLLLKVSNNVPGVELESEDVAYIKDLVGKLVLSPLIAGQALLMLECKPTGIEEKTIDNSGQKDK